MQELLGRLVALDPQASQGLRVIACFDELVVGNVNTRALLSAAASLAGCPAGFAQTDPPRAMRVDHRGELLPDEAAPSGARTADGQAVWLERVGEPLANDAIILERLALSLRVRHGRGRAALDSRRHMAVVLDGSSPIEQRRDAGSRLGLRPGPRYRVVIAPLFARWDEHPVAPEDVVPTSFGPMHVLVVPAPGSAYSASPSGTGATTGVDDLPRSFRTALVALRLWDESCGATSDVERFGGLVEMLVNLDDDAVLPDVDALDRVAAHAWGPVTLEALVRAGSVREAARLAEVHHSTMQQRLDAVVATVGFDPLDGYGKARLGMAWLAWRLRHSRVLDLPPTGG